MPKQQDRPIAKPTTHHLERPLPSASPPAPSCQQGETPTRLGRGGNGLAGCTGGRLRGGRGLGAWSCGQQSRFDDGPGQAGWQQDGDDVGGVVPGLELLADLIAGSVGGELVEDDLGGGRDGPSSRAGAGGGV